MQLQPFVAEVQTQLIAAAQLGSEEARRTAEVLAAAAEPALRLALLQAVSAMADEVTAELLDTPGAPTITARLDGDEVRIDVDRAATDVPEVPVDEGDAVARISLRLSEALKAGIEAAARADAMSVNTWLVRAASAAQHGASAGHPGKNQHRVTGWING